MSERAAARGPETRPLRWTLSWSDPPHPPPPAPLPELPPGADSLATLLADSPGEWAEVLEAEDVASAELLAEALGALGLETAVGARPLGVGVSVYAAHPGPVEDEEEDLDAEPVAAAPTLPAVEGPTPDQAAAIEEILAENAAAVSALRAARRVEPVVRGRLPATTVEVSVSELPRYLRTAARAAVAEGWVVGRQGNDHFRWAGPGGESVSTPNTGNSNGSSPRNVLAGLRRAGVPVTSLRG